ncbi:ABC-3 protein [Desulfobulbus propionicus DSM 2032]|jgi:zinc transport system permease protein|uniref:ABC-3 protein n=1 Tax=Desulfobulbus propionicus (strain ATCC 33891 / DSM 2032 / VKM B-1956 / 1pr3) TaxID=577650 RepID=A0A7U4DMW0_DESPD|nr:metal ABC transporter permease [Desulfobulbus propionicus]ADW16432.1 ABC-3 protein [Desulfobulbus propionicus DSM 2032]
MPDLSPLYALLPQLLPFDCLHARFMQQALLGLLLLAPMAAVMGILVVNFRMAFFSDAISHSAFAGVALGLLFSADPGWTMPAFGLLVGLGIMILQRHSSLSSDTVIGVFFSAMVAFGLAIVSRDRSLARDLQRFLYGDILTISDAQILWLVLLFVVLMLFLALSYNHLLYIGLNPTLAQAHRIRVAIHQYCFAGLLALVVMFSVQAVGVLLVTALLIVPAAAARNVARSAGAMFWWALLISLTSAVSGLLISAQDWARTATGATIILIACGWFMLSLLLASRRREQSA